MIYILALILFAIVVSVLLVVLLRRKSSHVDSRLAKTLRESQQAFGNLNEQTGHSFDRVDLFTQPTYSTCSGQPLLLGGLHCFKCGISISVNERKESGYLKCKPIFVDDNKTSDANEITRYDELNAPDEDLGEADEFGIPCEHHLVFGNLPLLSSCAVCNQSCGQEPRLVDYYCSLCHRCIHERCLGLFHAALETRFCDMGRLLCYAIPPWCARVQRSFGVSPSYILKGNMTNKASLSRICRPRSVKSWQPLLVFANRLSGSSDAVSVLQAFRFYLNPVCQVFDLSVHQNPTAVFEAMNDLLPIGVSFTVLVAGGDGTFGWIANSLSSLNTEFLLRKRQPQIAILPLGTGNDLARSLNLGSGHIGPLDVIEYLSETLEKCKLIKLDRWKINLQRVDRSGNRSIHREDSSSARVTRSTGLGPSIRSYIPKIIRQPNKQLFMFNYVSIGADAAVTLSFSRRRKLSPWLCKSRLINKLLYGIYGLFDMYNRECHDLYHHIRLTCDGKVIKDVPSIETLVVMNISSYAGGCRVLELGAEANDSGGMTFSQQKFDDGIIEVFGVYSSMHTAQMLAGFSSPVRIAQAKTVKIDLLKRFPVQCDGEAWSQSPVTLVISRDDQVRVLARSESE